MAGATVYMTTKKQSTLQEIHEVIHCIELAEQVSKHTQVINDVIIWTLTYEKYFLRNNSYTSVTIVLTEYGQEQTACVVSSGGGEGMLNCSYGSNREFAESCVQALESCGFEVVTSDLDPRGKGLFERFIK